MKTKSIHNFQVGMKLLPGENILQGKPDKKHFPKINRQYFKRKYYDFMLKLTRNKKYAWYH